MEGTRATALLGLLSVVAIIWGAPKTFAGIIPLDSSPSLSVELPKLEKPLSLRNQYFISDSFMVSSLWGSEAIGADLARQDLQSIYVSPVNVVVSDNGVKVGALHEIAVPGEARKPRMIKLNLTETVGEGRFADLLKKFIPKEIPDPRDPTRKDSTPHGSHVAGIIGALNPEFGVSPYAEISNMDIFKGVNLFKEENLAAGLETLLEKKIKVDVINMSHALPSDRMVREPLGRLVRDSDTIAVVAAGNEGSYISWYQPLFNATDLVVVGAYGISGALAPFSNYGESVDIVAPGELIVSRGDQLTWGHEKLSTMSGTSMAAPYVSGTFATLRALLPNARADDLKQIVYKSAIDLGRTGKDALYGHGLLNTLRATSVAKRLLKAGLTSTAAIRQAVTVEDNFKFDEDARAAMIAARKMGIASDEFEDGLRRRALLTSTTDGMKELGSYYRVMGDSDRGFGWLYAAANRETNSPRKRELKYVSSMIWNTQARRYEAFFDKQSLFSNLSNADLLIQTYASAPENAPPSVASYFQRKLLSLDSSRMGELGQIIAQRQTETSNADLVVAIGMGK